MYKIITKDSIVRYVDPEIIDENGVWKNSIFDPNVTTLNSEIFYSEYLPKYFRIKKWTYKNKKFMILPEYEKQIIDDVKKDAIEKIDNDTSQKILSGFSYEIDSEIFHFSYDMYDQQNFSDYANMILSGNNISSIYVNAYKDSEVTQFEFENDQFMDLYINGALKHKMQTIEDGKTRKAEIMNMEHLDDIEIKLTEWNL